MGKRARVVSVHKMHMFHMLPKTGMFYSFWEVSFLALPTSSQETTFSNNIKRNEDQTNQTSNERRILPPNMSTKIMVKFLHKFGNGATKNDFDRDVSQLFTNAKGVLRRSGYNGQDPSSDPVFWRVPKMGTFLETASDNTVARFAAKMLQARETVLEKQSRASKHDCEKDLKKQIAALEFDYETGMVKQDAATKFDCETAKAIDDFNGVIQIAFLASGGAQALMSDEQLTEETTISMASYTSTTDQFNNDDDTDASETEYDEEPTDDESPANKRVQVEKPFTTDGEARPSFAMDLGGAPLTIRTRASMDLDGANKTSAQEPAMPSTNNSEAAPDVAPTGGIEWSENMDLETHVKWYWAQKNSKPASYYDEVLARAVEDSKVDYEEDDSDPEMDLDM